MKVFNRALALLFGLALLAGGLALGAEVAAAAFGRPPLLAPWPRWGATLQALSLADPHALLASGGLALAGFLLLIAEIRPWPTERLALGGDPSTRWWLQRRSLERYLAERVVATTSATDARVRLRPHRRFLEVRVGVTAADRARPGVEERVEAALNRFGVPGDRRVRVRLRRTRRVD